jgi:hypothetical protein
MQDLLLLLLLLQQLDEQCRGRILAQFSIVNRLNVLLLLQIDAESYMGLSP